MRIGIDVGGTNTDAVLLDGTRVLAEVKSPTTRDATGAGAGGQFVVRTAEWYIDLAGVAFTAEAELAEARLFGATK